jgi:hypothetical protein
MNRKNLAERPTDRAIAREDGRLYVAAPDNAPTRENQPETPEEVNLNHWGAVPLWIYRFADSAVRVYGVLSAFRDADGFSYPGRDRVCKLADIHRDTYTKAIAELVAGGAIEKMGRAGWRPNGGNDKYLIRRELNQKPVRSAFGSDCTQNQKPVSAEPKAGLVGPNQSISFDEDEEKPPKKVEVPEASKVDAPELLKTLARELFDLPAGALEQRHVEAFLRGLPPEGEDLTAESVAVLKRYREANQAKVWQTLHRFLPERHTEMKRARDWAKPKPASQPAATASPRVSTGPTEPNPKPAKAREAWQIGKDLDSAKAALRSFEETEEHYFHKEILDSDGFREGFKRSVKSKFREQYDAIKAKIEGLKVELQGLPV